MTRQILRIRDTGLAFVGQVTPSRVTVNNGEWLQLHGADIKGNVAAVIGQKDERILEDSNNPNSMFVSDDVSHNGVKPPELVVTGSVDLNKEEHQDILKSLLEFNRSQGIKMLEGDWVNYIWNPCYVRIRDVSFNPPRYSQSENKLDYTMKMVVVRV